MSDSLINHSHFAEALKDLVRAIESARPGQIVWLTGPSGCGKSVLLMSALNALCGSPEKWPMGGVPAIRVRATLSDRNKFNPKDLALRLCVALDDPAPDWVRVGASLADPNLSHRKLEEMTLSDRWQSFRASSTEHRLRLGFERGARARGLRWIVIEEAASILKVHLHQSSDNYMTGLMQLAEETRCVLIMVGTPASSDLWLKNRELRNRSVCVWVRPYRIDEAPERRGLATLLKALGRRYPLSPPDLLVKNLELLYLNGGGIFGTTTNYLDRADARRIRQGDEQLLLDHLRDASSTLEDQSNLVAERMFFDSLCYATSNTNLTEALKRGGSRI